MNSELDELTKLSVWYKDLPETLKIKIIQLFEKLNANIELQKDDFGEIGREKIDDLIFYIWDALNTKSKENVKEHLIEIGFDKTLSKLIINNTLEIPSAKRDANLIRSLNDVEFEKVIKTIFYDVYLKADIDSWEDFLSTSGIRSEVSEATLRLIKSLSSRVCCREFGINISLVEDYGFTEIQANYLLSLIKENIEKIEKLYMVESFENIKRILIDIHTSINIIVDKIEELD